MQLERKERIEMIEDGLSKIRRSLDDLIMLENSDKTIIDILKLLVSIKTIIGNDDNLPKDNLSSDYQTQVLVIESEIETYLSLHNYQIVSYPQGKKTFSDTEKYTCKQLIETDKKELDHTVERTVSLGIALSDGEIVIPPEINLYKYRGGERKFGLPKFISPKLMIISLVLALALSFGIFVIDRDNLFFSKPLFFLGVSISLVVLILILSLAAFIVKGRNRSTIVSDYVGFTSLFASLFLIPIALFEFKIYKIIGTAVLLLLGLAYIIVRVVFYYSKKESKANCLLFEFLEKNNKYILGFSFGLLAINLVMMAGSKFDNDIFNILFTVIFSALYALLMVWLILASKDKGKRIGLFVGYVLSLILVSINLSWCLIGIDLLCAILTLFLVIGDKLWQKKN